MGDAGEQPPWLPLKLPLTLASSPAHGAGRCSRGRGWRAAGSGNPSVSKERPAPETHGQGKDVQAVPIACAGVVQRPVLQHLLGTHAREHHRPPHGCSMLRHGPPWDRAGCQPCLCCCHSPAALGKWPSRSASGGREGVWQWALRLTHHRWAMEGPQHLWSSVSPHGMGFTGWGAPSSAGSWFRSFISVMFRNTLNFS